MSTIRVAGALENALMRQGIASFIESLPDMQWIGDAGDTPEVVEHIRRQAPDVALIDLQLRKLGGLTLIREIGQGTPEIKVVALTGYNSDAQARAAVRAGAKGFVVKHTTPEELVDTIRAVHAGELRLPKGIVEQLAHSLTHHDLSDREVEVLSHVAEVSATKTVAARMSISEGTVKVHMKHILEKMGARDRTHAVVMAIKQGLIPV